MNDLTQEYMRNAEIHAAIDYSDSKSVRKGNKAADRMRNLGESEIEKNELLELLSSDHPSKLWAAHHLLEFKNLDSDEEAEAIKPIEIEASKTGTNAMGERMFLSNYKQQK